MIKQFDVVVFGATGFTGALVARHLITEPESALGSLNAVKWALAARSATKLTALKEELMVKLPEVDNKLIAAIPTLLADSSDMVSLLNMIKQTKVVLSLVGPYTLYGELLVKLCAENGIHYCDLTGEVLWVREMIHKYQDVAAKSGAIIVNSCGVDSAPSDFVAYALAARIRKLYGKEVKIGRVDFLITDSKGSVSGGTFASVLQMVEGKTSKDLSETCNPFVLTDEKTIKQKKAQGLVDANSVDIRVRFDKTAGSWTSLFLGQLMNQAVVHRSNYLLNDLYGKRFVYCERFALGGVFTQALITAVSVVLTGMLYFKWTRKLIQKLAPAPGEGPSEELMVSGCFIVEANGYTEDGELAAKLKAIGKGDPGYYMTIRMITECAFCLAKKDLRDGSDDTNDTPSVTGGFFTPAFAFGHKLSSRMHTKGFMTFDLKDVAVKHLKEKNTKKELATAF
ncbi:hypothetical protein V7S43_003973 [Phytophthora oleae]|uniref:Saccharopine dehydrogenase NADP binding domain-containing protein n=1 Tax=Phytophthora oleae TaxID=2107226 RepID=A0ABD3FV29_9STRA